MSHQPMACDEPLDEMRADAALRAVAALDSVEPSRALDRAVLGQARAAASGRAPRMDTRARALRWGFPVAVAVAAVCAVVVHRTASRPGAPRVADQRLLAERMQPPRSTGDFHGWLVPALSEVSAALLSIRTAPPHRRGSGEETPRAATRSSERASRREREEREWNRWRPILVEDVATSIEGSQPPPRPRKNGALPPDAGPRATTLSTTAHSSPP